MLIPLTNADDLPWKLGRRLPRDYEKKANIAEMEAFARALDIDLTVKWVPDERTCWGDFDHPAAEMPDPMAVVAAEFEKMCLRRAFPRIVVDPGRVDGDRTAAVKYWLDESDNIHIEPIPARDLYAEVGITDIMRGVDDGSNKTATGIMLRQEAAARNSYMNRLADRISCVPSGTVARVALRAQEAVGFQYPRTQPWWQQ
jgi:hypothetical protein